MNTRLMIDYLSELSQNNSREWFHAHKEAYKSAMTAFEEMLQAFLLEIGKFDSSILHHNPKDLTFKLVRDTRFSTDKSPYNPAFRAHISSQGKLPIPTGYYICIKPGGQSFLGGGLFADMFKEATSMVRRYIAAHPDEWEQIIHAPDFRKYFTVQGTALKNVPKEFDPAHPQAEYLKFKSWYLEYFLEDSALQDGEQFLSHGVEIFKQMKPFNDYLNLALEGFEMPKR